MDRVRGALVRRYVYARAAARAHPGMLMRKTRSDLQHAVDIMNRRWPRNDGYQYGIDWAYGQPALCLVNDKFCGRNLSPRDTLNRVATWIAAFMEGLEQQDDLWIKRLKSRDPLVVELMAQNS